MFATTAKSALQALDEFFTYGDPMETKRLWDVLGLVRGPDDQSNKTNSTATVRGRAFPRAYAAGKLLGEANSRSISEIKGGSSHFGQHAQSAKEALLAIFPEAPTARAYGAGEYNSQAALVSLGKIQG